MYYKGPHSAKAWLAFLVFCVVLALFEHAFLAAVISLFVFLGGSFVIFKLIGGEGGFFK